MLASDNTANPSTDDSNFTDMNSHLRNKQQRNQQMRWLSITASLVASNQLLRLSSGLRGFDGEDHTLNMTEVIYNIL